LLNQGTGEALLLKTGSIKNFFPSICKKYELCQNQTKTFSFKEIFFKSVFFVGISLSGVEPSSSGKINL